MRSLIAATISLAAAMPLDAQTVPDLSTATPIAGHWTYASVSDGSEATFADASAVQLWVHCARATRRVTSPRRHGFAPQLGIWSTGLTRNVAASFDAATGRLTAQFGAYDGLLDSVANSRGRIGFAAGTQPVLVVPAWPELARVVEDCRA